MEQSAISASGWTDLLTAETAFHGPRRGRGPSSSLESQVRTSGLQDVSSYFRYHHADSRSLNGTAFRRPVVLGCGETRIIGRSSAPVLCPLLSPETHYIAQLLLQACGLMSSTTTIRQSAIPGGPSSAIVRNYSLGAIAEMEVDFRAALPPEPFAVGVSIGLAPVGPSIDTLALATQDQVFCLSFQQPPSSSQRTALRRLLDVKFLTGFELPYTITLLAHTLDSDVSGYDLSSLRFGDITPPGDFLHSRDVFTSTRSVNELWDGGILRNIDAKATGTLGPNYALRAWFTAMYVTLTPLASFGLHIPYSAAEMTIRDSPLGQRLSTQFIDRLVRFHESASGLQC